MPSAYRAKWLNRFLDSLYSTIDNNAVEVLVSCVEDDHGSVMVAEDYPLDLLWIRTKAEYERGSIWAFNELARRSTGDVLADLDDDQICHPHWLTNALVHLDAQGGGLVALNDCASDGNEYAAHFIVARAFLVEQMGGVLWPPMYRSWWCDREMSDKAKAADLYSFAATAVVTHEHWSFGLSAMDKTAMEGHKHHEADHTLYLERKAAGYPLNYEVILK